MPEPTRSLMIAVSAFTLAAAPAEANEQAVQAYDAAFFERFGPSTALDIVQQVPGFKLELGPKEERRGFSDNAGNVVIDGKRPPTKSESLEVILGRISAENVARVEIAPGAHYGADYVGKVQVLNVVLAREGGLSGTLKVQATRQYTGDIIPDGNVALTYKNGDWQLTGSLASGRKDVREEGHDTLFDFPGEQLLEYRAKTNLIRDRTPALALSIAREGSDAPSFKVHARYQPKSYFLRQDTRATRPSGGKRTDLLVHDIGTDILELGGDIRFPLGGGELTLLGLATQTEKQQKDSLVFGIADPLDGFEQSIDSSARETIGRITWQRTDLAGFDIEATGEVAYNRLSSAVEVFDIAPGGERRRLDLPVDQALVEEWRGLASLQAGGNLTKKNSGCRAAWQWRAAR